jgi:uncharacterized membrane protein YsdA (DUF1294 family)
MSLEHIVIGILSAINLFSFFILATDKRKSEHGGTRRTPEGFLFFLAVVFGSVGVYAGMVLFRHKTRKWYFQLGIPLLILQNLATLYLVSEMFSIQLF